jgi:hypothetical protein
MCMFTATSRLFITLILTIGVILIIQVIGGIPLIITAHTIVGAGRGVGVILIIPLIIRPIIMAAITVVIMAAIRITTIIIIMAVVIIMAIIMAAVIIMAIITLIRRQGAARAHHAHRLRIEDTTLTLRQVRAVLRLMEQVQAAAAEAVRLLRLRHRAVHRQAIITPHRAAAAAVIIPSLRAVAAAIRQALRAVLILHHQGAVRQVTLPNLRAAVAAVTRQALRAVLRLHRQGAVRQVTLPSLRAAVAAVLILLHHQGAAAVHIRAAVAAAVAAVEVRAAAAAVAAAVEVRAAAAVVVADNYQLKTNN